MDSQFTHVKDWYSATEYVDVETGEIISKKHAMRDYQIINKTRKIKINKNNGTGTITWTNECRKSIQYKLW